MKQFKELFVGVYIVHSEVGLRDAARDYIPFSKKLEEFTSPYPIVVTFHYNPWTGNMNFSHKPLSEIMQLLFDEQTHIKV